MDAAKGTVKVSGGISYGALGRALEEQGYAIHNLASLPHISVAGAIQTGTHGSGVNNPSLAAAVVSVDLVRASGELVTLRPDDDEFLASVVGMGALGIVTGLELAVRPSYEVRQRVLTNLSWEGALANFQAIASSAYSVSFFTDYTGDTIPPQVWLKALDTEAPLPDLFGATAATAAMHPLPDMSAENCTEQLDVAGKWLDRLPHFRHEFTPSNGEELQSELLLPLEQAPAALQAVRGGLADKLAPLLFVSEIRTVAADEFWLSPFYQQQSVALHFTWKPLQAEVEAVLPELEEALRPFGARPHWGGKLFTPSQYDFASLYPRFEDFRALVQANDPSGKFRNELLDSVLGISAATHA